MMEAMLLTLKRCLAAFVAVVAMCGCGHDVESGPAEVASQAGAGGADSSSGGMGMTTFGGRAGGSSSGASWGGAVAGASGNATGGGGSAAGGGGAGAGGIAAGGSAGGGTSGLGAGAGTGAAGVGGAAPDPLDWFDPAPPLPVTAHDAWHYVPVEGAVCANGTQSGFFVNFSHNSPDVLIFLLGGGICYDQASCALHTDPVLNGMGNDPFSWWMGNGERTNGVFQRDNPNNPWKDASYVVLPHCTVDFHSANKESTYASTGTIQQRGYRNVQLVMNHVVPTFADPNRNVTIAGFSAGGVGSVANYHQIASAFESYGHLPPFLVDDAGPIQTQPFFSANSNAAIREGWQLDDTIGTWCPTCADEGYHEALYWNHQLHPGMRSSLLCSYGDVVVIGLYTLFDAANALRFEVTPIPTAPFTYTTMTPGLEAFRVWSEGFPTQGMHRNLLYHAGDRHGALTVGPIHEAFTPAIVPFLRAQLNRDDPLWYSPHL